MEEHATISACTLTKREKWELHLPLMTEKFLQSSMWHIKKQRRVINEKKKDEKSGNSACSNNGV